MTPSTDERQPAERASEWLVKLQDGDADVRLAFFAWLRQSPRHVEEFLLAAATWHALADFGRSHAQEVARLLAETPVDADVSAVVVPLRPAASAGPALAAPRRPRWKAWIAAAAVAAVVIGVALAVTFDRGTTYATAKGEQRLIRLEDGSMVRLNTDSVVRVRFTESGRNLKLLRGEALFTVYHDGSRPFRVDSGGTVVEAVGTQFNVYRRASGTSVSVLEGTVRITAGDRSPSRAVAERTGGTPQTAAVLLSAGEQADASPSGRIMREAHPDLARAIAWQDLRLIFRSERLEDAVLEVNRYSSRRVRVEGPLKDMRITAVFDANDSDALLRFLRGVDGVVVERRPDEVVVRSAETHNPGSDGAPQ